MLELVKDGEDGSVKMWSMNGMLRSVLAQHGRPVYGADWNSDATKIAYSCAENCFIKSLKAQTNPIKWKAHEGVVLCLNWSAVNDLIATGGEDCRYRIWDCFGRPLYSSNSHNFPINSVSWNPDGELLAVGSYNLIRLCDKAGVCRLKSSPVRHTH
jgi:intraflagellar transport protein 80